MNIVEFNNVSKKRKDFVIRNMTFTIPKGYITGFIGPNGSGKTTTIQMLMDIIQKDGGEIMLFGASHQQHSLKQNIGFVYDDLYMYDEFTIKNMHTVISPLYHHWNENLFRTYLQQFQLPYKKKLKHFSKGMKMKCSLLFALAHEPEFIIMDEPTAGLDPIFRRELLQLLQEKMVNEQQTIFLSTHMTTDLDRMADFIVFINDGEIVFQQSMEEIREMYHLVKGEKDLLDQDIRTLFVGIQETDVGFHALFKGDPHIFADFHDKMIIEQATLEDIMYFFMKRSG